MWPFRKNKNQGLKNCLNTHKKSLLDLQATLKQANRDPVRIISEARIQIARTLNNIDRILEHLK